MTDEMPSSEGECGQSVTAFGVPLAEIDPPVRPLILVMNQIPGVRTRFSCAGHSDPEDTDWLQPAYVLFTVESLATLEGLVSVIPMGITCEAAMYDEPPRLAFVFRWHGGSDDDRNQLTQDLTTRMAILLGAQGEVERSISQLRADRG